MSEHDKNEVDDVSGVETTGHEWDGIKELNNPLPKWWLYTFYATILWTIGMSVAYPAWPMITEATKGVLGYTTRGEHAELVAAAQVEQAVFVDRIAESSLDEIVADRELAQFARAGGAAAYQINCSQCHGSGAAGATGYPNLLDDEWIWGGDLQNIHQTIAHGIRQTDDEGYETAETRFGEMPAFVADGLLEAEDAAAAVEYVLQISGQEHDAAIAAAGEAVFYDNCSSCHGENGEGLRDLGAPTLTDAIWLYGGDRDALVRTVWNGRAGMMPAWNERLPDTTIKQLAVYVHGLGGGE